MMDAELQTYNTLKHLCGGRVYPDHLPQGCAFPAIRYLQAGGTTENANCAWQQTVRMQIDIFAGSAPERRQLVQDVQDALDDNGDFAPQAAPIHSYDYEFKAYRAVLEYLVF